MSKGSKQLVMAFFDNEAAADSAVAALKGWDKATESIKLGAIGILVKDENGKIKQQKLGQRAAGKGVSVGVILGLVAAVLSGGVTLIGGLVGGSALGGVMGEVLPPQPGLVERGPRADWRRVGRWQGRGGCARKSG